MRKSQIDSAGVKVQCFAERWHGHGRTLMCHPRPSRANFCLPECSPGFGAATTRSSPLSFFIKRVVIPSLAGLKCRFPNQSSKVSYSGNSQSGNRSTHRCRKLRAVSAGARATAPCRNMIRRRNPNAGRFHAYRLAIRKQCCGILFVYSRIPRPPPHRSG